MWFDDSTCGHIKVRPALELFTVQIRVKNGLNTSENIEFFKEQWLLDHGIIGYYGPDEKIVKKDEAVRGPASIEQYLTSDFEWDYDTLEI